MALPKDHAQKVRAYRIATLKLLVSDYLAFGTPVVIDAALFVFKMWLCYLCAHSLDNVFGLRERFDQPGLYVLAKFVLSCVGLLLWAGVGALL